MKIRRDKVAIFRIPKKLDIYDERLLTNLWMVIAYARTMLVS
jgi:hypothetical protein